MKTQRQNILRHLLHGPLCGVHDDWLLGRRIAARIHELRQVGFTIDTEPCNIYGHAHRTPQRMYVLERPASQWIDHCAHCGPNGAFTYTGEKWFSLDVLLFGVVCGRCGKRDYR